MKKKRKGYSLGGTVFLAVVFLGLCVGACAFFLWQSAAGGLSLPDPPATQAPTGPQTGEGPQDTTPALQRKNEFYNLLLVGRDATGSNTDVLMVLSYDVPNASLSVMQIPRDTYVTDPINQQTTKRVNAVYALAYNQAGRQNVPGAQRQKYALEYLKNVVGDTFGIELHRYLYLDLGAFRQIVDILGGVRLNVGMNMDYDDPEQDLHIHLKKGWQTLNGAQAEGFVRYRKGYVDGDLGRLDAQKQFLSALAEKILSPQSLPKLPQLASSVYDHLVTDLSLSDLTYFAAALPELDPQKVEMATAPGQAYQTQAGAWYYGLYRQACLELVNRCHNGFTTPVTEEDMTLTEPVAPPQS